MTRRLDSRKRILSRILSLVVIVLLGSFLGAVADPSVDSLRLDETSKVLIFGAAGFIGAELALGLHRAFQCQLVLVDSMEYLPGASSQVNQTDDATTLGHRTENQLLEFELQRQRIFRVLQEVPNAKFYRVDPRPVLPDYMVDSTAVLPMIRHILHKHRITHIVNLVEEYSTQNTQERLVLPYTLNDPRMGVHEAILEELRLHENTNYNIPQYIYASSYQVYPPQTYQSVHNETITTTTGSRPMDEQDTLSAPASLAGGTKMLYEQMAYKYYLQYQIHSTALRFFPVYGPWMAANSPVMQMVDQAIAGETLLQESTVSMDALDWIFIDDAVDLVMRAMQVRNERGPVVFNVGTGQAKTLLDLARLVQTKFYPHVNVGDVTVSAGTVSYASTARVQEYLGFHPRFSLEQGLERLLAWQYDRSYPYGHNHNTTAPTTATVCSKFDTDCLRGITVFPCASECASESQCFPSFLDDVIQYTRALTANCPTVMYTVDLNDSLISLPTDGSHLDGKCNLAFVSNDSPLVQMSSHRGGFFERASILKHGYWILVPMSISRYVKKSQHFDALSLLPKLSPGMFFGKKTQHAIYTDSDVSFDSITALMHEYSIAPYSGARKSSTALLTGRFVEEPRDRPVTSQSKAYQTIRIALADELSSDSIALQYVDSSYMVHNLQALDVRVFRCDVFGEMLQWKTSDDSLSLGFIVSLHDMFSAIMSRKDGIDPWWTKSQVASSAGRRLSEEDAPRDTSSHEESDEEEEEEDKGTDESLLHDGFGLQKDGVAQGPKRDAVEKDRTGSSDEEVSPEEPSKRGDARDRGKLERDPNAFYLGIISADEKSLQYFARIVRPETVGAVRIRAI